MKYLFYLSCLVFVFFASCGQDQDPNAIQSFGEGVKSETILSMNEVWPMLATQDSVKVTMQARVTEVCQKKGCWMNVVAGPGEEQSMMVQFKDYGFFMPKDIAGRDVIVEGVVYKQITPVDELKHYAEDAGKSQEEIDAITMPEEETRFLASGVALLPADKEISDEEIILLLN